MSESLGRAEVCDDDSQSGLQARSRRADWVAVVVLRHDHGPRRAVTRSKESKAGYCCRTALRVAMPASTCTQRSGV
jgi:hypothetical protein